MQYYLKEMIPKTRGMARQNGVFTELEILVGKENGDLTGADRYGTYFYCTGMT